MAQSSARPTQAVAHPRETLAIICEISCARSMWTVLIGAELAKARPAQRERFGDRDRGGQNVPNARGGGELAPKVAPRRLGLLTPKLAIFCRISVERGQFQGALEIQNFTLPPIFGDLTPPYPGLQKMPNCNNFNIVLLATSHLHSNRPRSEFHIHSAKEI